MMFTDTFREKIRNYWTRMRLYLSMSETALIREETYVDMLSDRLSSPMGPPIIEIGRSWEGSGL